MFVSYLFVDLLYNDLLSSVDKNRFFTFVELLAHLFWTSMHACLSDRACDDEDNYRYECDCYGDVDGNDDNDNDNHGKSDFNTNNTYNLFGHYYCRDDSDLSW